jgi:hypothetical protein
MIVYDFLMINIFVCVNMYVYMDVVTGGRNCPVNFNKPTLQLNSTV